MNGWTPEEIVEDVLINTEYDLEDWVPYTADRIIAELRRWDWMS